MEKYENKELAAKERAQDLLEKLTLEEKVNQLVCKMIPAPIPGVEEGFSLEDGIGQLAIMGGKENPKEHAAMIRKLQEKVLESSRLRIPAVIHCEALSGPAFPNALTYPISISLGASFDPEIVKEMGDKIRRQMVAVGVRQALSPVLDISRDLRWGRINETYGNDPTLVSEMACAFVSGLQGKDYTKGVAATAKHFLGYSLTEGGINMARTMLDSRERREVYAKPFEAAIQKAGLLSVMNSYSEIEGRPICASDKILTDLLRDELGFDGLVVSDYMSIERLVNNFHVAKDLQDAAIQCLKAGLDVECPNASAYSDNLVKAVEKGLIDEKYIDRSCLRSLELKFKLGLFENPYPQEDSEIEKEFADTSQEGSLEASRKAMTLTKNEGILPIQDKNARILVVGPTGNSLRKMWSTYTAVAMEEMLLSNMAAMAGLNSEDGEIDTATMFGGKENPAEIEALIRRRYPQAKTIFQALNEKYPNVEYLMGCDYTNPEKTYIEAAVESAQKADIIIITVGGKNGYGGNSTNGEGVDTASEGLPGGQEELLQKIGEANPNFVVVHTDAKPLVSSYAYQNAKAILEGWLCCTYAGQAIAETLSGENNPGGRLQQDIPYAEGITTYHYQQNASHYKTLQSLGAVAYNDQKEVVARPFGYGLSYTTFKYSAAKLIVSLDEPIPVCHISVTVENVGDIEGDEVVQLYGKDVIGSVIRPTRELLGFKRIHLLKGEVKTIEFVFKLDILSFINQEKQWICEAGEYKFFLAKDSEDEEICLSYELMENLPVEYRKRDFWAKAQ